MRDEDEIVVNYVNPNFSFLIQNDVAFFDQGGVFIFIPSTGFTTKEKILDS